MIISIYNCRLSLKAIEDFTRGKCSAEATEFIKTWHQASRMLFGEESLSLRNVSLLIREFNNKARVCSFLFLMKNKITFFRVIQLLLKASLVYYSPSFRFLEYIVAVNLQKIFGSCLTKKNTRSFLFQKMDIRP